MRITENSGFSLLEVIISISILSIGLLGVASLQGSALTNDSFAANVTEANAWGQDKMEELLALAYTHTDLDTASNPHNDLNPPAGYTISWTVTGGPVLNSKQITITVQQQGRTLAQLSGLRSQMY